MVLSMSRRRQRRTPSLRSTARSVTRKRYSARWPCLKCRAQPIAESWRVTSPTAWRNSEAKRCSTALLLLQLALGRKRQVGIVARICDEAGDLAPEGIALLPARFLSAHTLAKSRSTAVVRKLRSAWRCTELMYSSPWRP